MRENPLPILAFLLAIATLPTWARASDTIVTDTIVEVERRARSEHRRPSVRADYGPRYKNPLAAGRNLRENRIQRQAIARNHRLRRLPRRRGHEGSSTFTALRYRGKTQRKRAHGPAYKNRKPDRRAGRG